MSNPLARWLSWPVWARIAALLAILTTAVTVMWWLLKRYDNAVLSCFDYPDTLRAPARERMLPFTVERIAERLGRSRRLVKGSLWRLHRRRLVIPERDGSWRLR